MSSSIRTQYNKIVKFKSILSKETDRGACLIAAAFLEGELEYLIRSKLVGNKKFVDSLFDFNGPIGTFSSKIKMAYSIGLISRASMKDLEIIRKIRNKFGHDYESINFDSESIKSELYKLKSHIYSNDEKGSIRTRSLLTNSVAGILVELFASLGQINSFTERQSILIEDVARKEEIKQGTIKIIDEILNADTDDISVNVQFLNDFTESIVEALEEIEKDGVNK